MNAVEAGTSPAVPAGFTMACNTPGPARVIARCQPIEAGSELAPLLHGLVGTAFQNRMVLANWFTAFTGRGGGDEGFLITLSSPDGVPLFALPLIRRRGGGIRRLELPSAGVIDYTTPLLNPDHPLALAPEALWALLLPVLPEADLVEFRGLAAETEAGANPLYLHPRTQPSRLVSLRIAPLLAREARLRQLAKPIRKKLQRRRKKFLALPGARFVIPQTMAEAEPFLARLDALQSKRIRAKGLEYGLDSPETRQFYTRVLAEGIEEGKTLIVAMMVGEEIIAVGYSILSEQEAVYVRMANAYGDYAQLALGLLVSDATMDEIHARGVSAFDFGLGDYRFKREFGSSPVLLRDLLLPLTFRGLLAALCLHLYQRLSLNPLLRRFWGRKPLEGRARS